MDFRPLAFGLLLALVPCPAAAESARETLTNAAFVPCDKAEAFARIDQAIRSAEAVLARAPSDREALFQKALAISYRGKLGRSRSDLMAARRGFEAVVLANPRDAEANIALAGWHLGAVAELGPLMARTALGATAAKGREALDRSLTLGGDRAMFPALESMQLIMIDPSDVAGSRRLAEAALKANPATPFDRLMQKQVTTLLPLLRAGDGKAAARTAKMLLPFGRVR